MQSVQAPAPGLLMFPFPELVGPRVRPERRIGARQVGLGREIRSPFWRGTAQVERRFLQNGHWRSRLGGSRARWLRCARQCQRCRCRPASPWMRPSSRRRRPALGPERPRVRGLFRRLRHRWPSQHRAGRAHCSRRPWRRGRSASSSGRTKNGPRRIASRRSSELIVSSASLRACKASGCSGSIWRPRSGGRGRASRGAVPSASPGPSRLP